MEALGTVKKDIGGLHKRNGRKISENARLNRDPFIR